MLKITTIRSAEFEFSAEEIRTAPEVAIDEECRQAFIERFGLTKQIGEQAVIDYLNNLNSDEDEALLKKAGIAKASIESFPADPALFYEWAIGRVKNTIGKEGIANFAHAMRGEVNYHELVSVLAETCCAESLREALEEKGEGVEEQGIDEMIENLRDNGYKVFGDDEEVLDSLDDSTIKEYIVDRGGVVYDDDDDALNSIDNDTIATHLRGEDFIAGESLEEALDDTPESNVVDWLRNRDFTVFDEDADFEEISEHLLLSNPDAIIFKSRNDAICTAIAEEAVRDTVLAEASSTSLLVELLRRFAGVDGLPMSDFRVLERMIESNRTAVAVARSLKDDADSASGEELQAASDILARAEGAVEIVEAVNESSEGTNL
jgi:hypothetical protein